MPAASTIAAVRRRPWTLAGDIAAEALVAASLLPLLAAFVASVSSPDGYAYWWRSARGWELAGVTLRIAAGSATVAVALAWVVSACCARLPRSWAMLSALLCCLPMLVPSSLLATVWMIVLGSRGVVLQFIRGLTGVQPGPGDAFTSPIYSEAGAAAVIALRYFGLAVLVLVHERLRHRAGEPAGRVFALPVWARALQLHLRAAARPLLAAWLLVALFAVNEHIIPEMLMVVTFGTQMVSYFNRSFDLPATAALAMPMAVLCAAIVLAAMFAGRRTWRESSSTGVEAAGGSRAGRVVSVIVLAAVFGVALGVPVAVLVVQTRSLLTLRDAYVTARPEIVQTAWFALVGGVACAAGGALAASRWVRRRREGGLTAAPLVLLNLAVPASVIGLGVMRLTRHGSDFPVLLAYFARFFPVAALLLFATWRGESSVGDSAARVHGVGAFRRAWRLVLPRRRGMIVAVAALCTVLIAAELEVSVLLVESGASTLGVRLCTMIHTAPEDILSALQLVILLAVAPPMALLAVIVFRQRRRARE